MSPIFQMIICVLSLQFVLCSAGCPRAIKVQFDELDDNKIVKKKDDWTGEAEKTYTGVHTPYATMTKFEKVEKDLEEVEASNAKKAEVYKENDEMRENLAEMVNYTKQGRAGLEKLRNEIAKAILDAGHIVFVSGPSNYIMLPISDLKDQIEKMYKDYQNPWILFRYAFDNIRKDIETCKPVEDGSAKKVISIKDGKIYYYALEFTIPQIKETQTLIYTLGSVQRGKFYLEKEKIQKHDNGIPEAGRVGEKTLSDFIGLYKDQRFIPNFHPKLNVEQNTPGLRNVKGKITEVSLKIFKECDTPDGKVDKGEVLVTPDDIGSWQNETLNKIAEIVKQSVVASTNLAPENVRIKYGFEFSYE